MDRTGGRRVYDRALQLARAMDSSADLVAPLIRLWLFHNTRGEFAKARESIRELFRVAHTLNDPNLLLLAHHAAWPTPMLCGDFSDAYKHVEEGLALYDERQHRHDAFPSLGHDPAVCAHALGAIIAWVLGQPERAAQHADSAMQLARRLEHAPTLAHALWFVCTYHALPGCGGNTHDKRGAGGALRGAPACATETRGHAVSRMGDGPHRRD